MCVCVCVCVVVCDLCGVVDRLDDDFFAIQYKDSKLYAKVCVCVIWCSVDSG